MKPAKHYYEKYWVKVTQYELNELLLSFYDWQNELTYYIEKHKNTELYSKLFMSLVCLQDLEPMLKAKQKRNRAFYAIQMNANQAFIIMHLLIVDNHNGLSILLHQLDKQFKNRLSPIEVKKAKANILKDYEPEVYYGQQNRNDTLASVEEPKYKKQVSHISSFTRKSKTVEVFKNVYQK